MKYIISIVLTLTFAIQAAGQNKQQSDYGVSDPKAAKILSDMSAKYKALNSIKASIKLTIESPEDDFKEEMSGSIFLKGSKYKLELGDQEITCDNKTMWTYLKDVNEVTIDNYEEDGDIMNPKDIFTMYESGFIYGFINEKTEGGRIIQVIDLTPTDKTKPFFKVRLNIDKVKKEIISAVIFDKNGNHYTYEVSNFVANPGLRDAFFTFELSKHPGIEVVDLRDF
ncbi:MAG: outer membrane lipoprotein carrier protein LolA [Bacteroidetes bacterium]|nr:outer membrane lipoprotein carrier protein LolA [Bacteroidota bacterium]